MKLQDKKLIYKNLLNFYTLITIRKRNQETNTIYYYIKMNKIARNKFNQRGENYKTLMKQIKENFKNRSGWEE